MVLFLMNVRVPHSTLQLRRPSKQHAYKIMETSFTLCKDQAARQQSGRLHENKHDTYIMPPVLKGWANPTTLTNTYFLRETLSVFMFQRAKPSSWRGYIAHRVTTHMLLMLMAIGVNGDASTQYGLGFLLALVFFLPGILPASPLCGHLPH
jgi:hypothetical protein